MLGFASPIDVSSLTKYLDDGTIEPNAIWEAASTPASSPGGCGMSTLPSPREPGWMNYNRPLHKAVIKNEPGSVTLLIERGADPNALNKLGRTPLHEAVAMRNGELISLLLENGADINATSTGGEAEDVLGVREAQRGVTPLAEAIYIGDEDMVNKLIAAGADVHAILEGGWTPLLLAIFADEVSIAERLEDIGGRPSIIAGQSEDTPDITEPDFLEAVTAFESSNDILPSKECFVGFRAVLKKTASAIHRKGESPGSLTMSNFMREVSRIIAETLGAPRPGVDTIDRKCGECTRVEAELGIGPIHKNSVSPFVEHCASRHALRFSAEEYGCPLCILLNDALDKNKEDSTRSHNSWDEFKKRAGVKVYLSFEHCHEDITLTIYCMGDVVSLTVNYIDDLLMRNVHPRYEIGSHAAGTRSINTNKMAANFLHHCATSHNGCAGVMSIPRPLPPMVIDLGEKIANNSSSPKIVRGSNIQAPYIALSYNILGVPLTDALLLSGSINPVLRDAIAFTSAIGHRYLWVENSALRAAGDNEDPLKPSAETLGIFARAAAVIFPPIDGEDEERGLFWPRTSTCTVPVHVGFHISREERKWLRGEKSAALYVHPRGWDDGEGKEKWRATQSLRTRIAGRSLMFSKEGLLHWQCAHGSGMETYPSRNIYPYWMWYEEKEREKLSGLRLPHSMAVAGGAEVSLGSLYAGWQNTVTRLAKDGGTDEVLALGKVLEPAMGEQCVAGIWSGEHCLASLLWAAKEPGELNPRFPSWSWASTTAKAEYNEFHKANMDDEKDEKNNGPRKWAASVKSVDWKYSPAHDAFSGAVTLRGSLRKLDDDIQVQKYFKNATNSWFHSAGLPSEPLNEHGESSEADKDRIRTELIVIESHLDRKSKPGEKIDYWVFPILKIGVVPPPKYGYPAYPEGRPESVLCLCLQSIDEEELIFRRVGIREFWDLEELWKNFKCDQTITIV